MYISHVQIKNYKCFFATEEIPLYQGFNVIVGQNDAGKTAFIEALSLQSGNVPHLSLKTVPHNGSVPDSVSEVTISFTLTNDELKELSRKISPFQVPVDPERPMQPQVEAFLHLYSEENPEIRCVFQGGQCMAGIFSSQKDPRLHRMGVQFAFSDSDAQPIATDTSITRSFHPGQDFGLRVASLLSQKIYPFKAERFNVGESNLGPDPILHSNAQNLAQVLHVLQTSNPSRFVRFNSLVTCIFPHVKQITTPLVSENRARIFIWPIGADSEREDLAIPLSGSGTGIGQVLAILYVVLTAQEPRTIIIDEPQSFLHPGAIRKLFEILKDHAQHQYIVTTHSPTVITSTGAETLLLVRKTETESQVSVINGNETQQLSLFLAEIGARLSDVFGADRILWVEGRTEELCFPVIVRKILKRPLLGTVILQQLSNGSDLIATMPNPPENVARGDRRERGD